VGNELQAVELSGLLEGPSGGGHQTVDALLTVLLVHPPQHLPVNGPRQPRNPSPAGSDRALVPPTELVGERPVPMPKVRLSA